MKIYDAYGREVAEVVSEKFRPGEHTLQIDLSGLPDGIYFVRVTAGDEAATGKVVKIQ